MTDVLPGVEPVPTAAERWRAIPRFGRVALLLAAVVVGAELALSLVGGIAGSVPAGSGSSSSFSTDASGVGAYAQLLVNRGYSVTKSTQPVSDLNLPTAATLVVLDPTSWTTSDSSTVATFVRAGGHVVVAGQPPGEGLQAALFGPGPVPHWHSQTSGTAHPVVAGPVVAGVDQVSSGSIGSLVPAGRAEAILAGSHLTFGVADEITGQPHAIELASSALFTNRLLAQRDNAALALNLAGPVGQPVVFDEYDNGYGRTGDGLAGLPAWWRWGLGLALAAVLVWMLSAARRFGPIERATRQLIPARITYADALASALATLPVAQLVDSVQPMRHEARTLLCRRSGMPGAAEDDALAAAARNAHVPDDVVVSVLRQPASGSDVVELGRALAWLDSQGGNQ